MMAVKKARTLREVSEAQLRKQREKHVQDGVMQFLRAHGWRVFRMNSGLFPGARGMVRIGEVGMPDLLAVHYGESAGKSCVMWVECKRRHGGKTAEQQRQWHEAEAKRGALIYTCSDLDAMRMWYYQRFGFLHADNLFVAAESGGMEDSMSERT